MEIDSDGSTGDPTIHPSTEHPANIQISKKNEENSPAVKTDDEKSLLYKIIQDQAKQIAEQTTQITTLQKQIEKLTTQVSLLTSQLSPSFPLDSSNTKRKLDSQTPTNNSTATEDENSTQDDGFATVRRRKRRTVRSLDDYPPLPSKPATPSDSLCPTTKQSLLQPSASIKQSHPVTPPLHMQSTDVNTHLAAPAVVGASSVGGGSLPHPAVARLDGGGVLAAAGAVAAAAATQQAPPLSHGHAHRLANAPGGAVAVHVTMATTIGGGVGSNVYTTMAAPAAVHHREQPQREQNSRHGTSASGGDIVKCGLLKKLKTSRKKWFVLRSETPDASARLEYYDSEKKWAAGLPAKRSIPLKTCFNINRRQDTKHKHVIALYTKDDCFCVVLESEEELDSWLRALLALQQGDEVTDGEVPRPTF
ncbi:unnamed protein product, partial [Callosobruchus maculatus]